MGEAVGAFADGRFFSCAMQAPPRNHRAAWASMGRGEKEASMGPLREPRSFCVRSFEAAPSLLPPLREEEASLRARGFDVRFVDGALSNRTAAEEARPVWRYASHRWGETAASLDFRDVHVERKPLPLSSRTVLGRSYDLNEIVRAVVKANASSVLALRLDVEGGEWWVLRRLLDEPALLCRHFPGSPLPLPRPAPRPGDALATPSSPLALRISSGWWRRALQERRSWEEALSPPLPQARHATHHTTPWRRLTPRRAPPRCSGSVSYIFAEFHSAASAPQRERLRSYGLEADAFETLKERVHAAMEAPGCRLRLYWRSFWASCGDKQRFEWRDAPQARDVASLGEEALRKMGLPSRLRVVKG